MFFQELPVIGKEGQILGFDEVQGIGQPHIPVSLVVAVGFPVRGDMDELRVVSGIGKSARQTPGEVLAVPLQRDAND